ncbi:MAG: Ig-like domain-containing protein [Deltaproteobacteria bacterium]|nr:Ig-like domain-containing protein [Deltaproteobacteria bacterium]
MQRSPTSTASAGHLPRGLLARGRLATATLCALALATAALGCSDPPIGADGVAADANDASADGDGFLVWVDIKGGGLDGVDEDVLDTDVGDAAEDADASADVDAKEAFEWPDEDTDIGPPPDVSKPDVSYGPLHVVSTDPPIDGTTAGTLAAFTVTFDQPLEAITAGPYTVKVKAAGGGEVSGTITVTGAKMAFAADAKVLPNRRIEVQISTLVTGPQGQTLEQPYDFHFHTPGYPDTEAYAELAARFAPTFDVVLSDGTDAAWDVPRWPGDFVDPANPGGPAGFWQLDEASTLAAAGKTLARVGWAAIETKSHVFLHYLAYWPKRVSEAGNPAFQNDTALVTVVVARLPSPHPVGLRTYFKRKDDERMWLWLTSDAGLLPKGASPGNHGVRGVFAADTLFPEASDALGCGGEPSCKPRRAGIWLRGGMHQACLLLDKGETGGAKACFWDDDVARVRLVPSQSADEVPFSGAKKGEAPKSYGYTLEPLETTFWPRRQAVTIYDSPLTFSYKPPPGRPAGTAGAVGSKFLGGGSSDFGRPPWAARWKPASNETFYDLPRGTVFFDPSFAIFKRMGGEAANLPPFDDKAGTGLSNELCFDAYLDIDQRDAAGCKP